MPVQVALFSLTGEQFDLPPVVLNAKEVRAFNLQDYIQSSNFREGNLQVIYQGKRLELGGVVQIVDTSRSLIFDEELSEMKYFTSTKLEGVWWTKWNNVEMLLAISNTTANPIAAVVAVEGTIPRQINPQTIYLQPHQTRVLSVDEIVGRSVDTLERVGGISITHNGQSGGILARGLVQKVNSGYSNVIEFSDPAKSKSANLDGVGLRIGNINGQSLTQGVVARNIGNSRVKLNGIFSFKKQNSSGEITIPDVWLNAGEVKEINIASILSDNNITSVLASGLHFEHNGQPGQVIIAALSISQDGNNVFQVPFKDAKLSSSTGTYPYSIADNSRAIVYLQNVSDSPRNYKMQIDYEGGSYVLGVKTLAARQVIAYDIRKLRDEQIPDINGHTIPQSATSGKAYWSIHGSGDRAIIGRIEQADLVGGLSSTAACGRCCPDSFYGSYLDPGSVSGFPGSTTSFTAMEEDRDCFGGYRTPYPTSYPVFFSSSDTLVATINSSGLATGVDVGTTIISADFTGTTFTNCAAEAGNEEYCCNQSEVPAHCEANCTINNCYFPTNFRQDGQGTNVNGVLHFHYLFDSSSGDLNDLSQCTIGEIVTYLGMGNFHPPTPPFANLTNGIQNPNINDHSATPGFLDDDHGTGGTFVTPYSEASYTATQYYRYKCPCKNNGNYVNVAGPNTIVRSVSRIGQTARYKYTITKSGSSATISPLP